MSNNPKYIPLSEASPTDREKRRAYQRDKQREYGKKYQGRRRRDYKPKRRAAEFRKGFDQTKHCVVCGTKFEGHGLYAYKGLSHFFLLPELGYFYCSRTCFVPLEEIKEQQLSIIERNTGWTRL